MNDRVTTKETEYYFDKERGILFAHGLSTTGIRRTNVFYPNHVRTIRNLISEIPITELDKMAEEFEKKSIEERIEYDKQIFDEMAGRC
jgi:hypothetical protein